MKKILIGLAIAAAAVSASAATFWQNGYLYGNVCRDGVYYHVMPVFKLVGSSCPMVDNWGVIRGWGFVSNE